MKTIRKACVQAVFDEFETQGEIVHTFKDVDAEAMRSLGHIVGYIDLDGSQELASIGKDQARTFIQSIGGAR